MRWGAGFATIAGMTVVDMNIADAMTADAVVAGAAAVGADVAGAAGVRGDEEYRRMAGAVRRLREGGAADLAAAARAARLSPSHFQRRFKRWVGVSPRQFAAALTLAQMQRRLADGECVLEAAWDCGLSGGGRAHDLFVGFDAVTPGDFQRRGKPLRVRFGRAPTFLGTVLVAQTERGVCLLRFAGDDSSVAKSEDSFRAELLRRLPLARLLRDSASARKTADTMFDPARRAPLAVCGTNFQIAVWRALLAIPSGCIANYGMLARALGKPRAAMAVGRAAAANPAAVLIPCHRLLAADGALAGYAWGLARKRALLAREFCR